MGYEALMLQYPQLTIKEISKLPKGLAGLNIGNEIHLDKRRCQYEKHGILAEEIGHYEKTHGDITNITSIRNWKLELVARRWGYEKIVSLDKLIECHETGHKTLDEVCMYLEVTPKYLETSIDHYLSRHGMSILHKGYEIFFDPLNIRRVKNFT